MKANEITEQKDVVKGLSINAINIAVDTVDIREYLYVIRNNILAILAFSFIVTLLVGMIVYSMTPIYSGVSTLLIEAAEQKIVSIEEVYQMGQGRSEYYSTQFEILKSRDLAESVVKKYEQDYRRIMFPAKTRSLLDVIMSVLTAGKGNEDNSDIPTKVLVSDFMTHTAITPVRGTQLVKIAFESPDPEFAAKMANELAKAYIESNLDARLSMTQMAATWLSSRIDGLRAKLQDSEQRLQQYREQEGVVDAADDAKTLAYKQLDDLTSRLAEVRQQRVEAENIAAQVNALTDRSPQALSAIPAVLRHSLVQQFKQQESQAQSKFEEVTKRYGPLHPKYIAAKSELDSARKNTSEQITKVVEGIQKEYEVTRATEDSLTREIETLKDRVQETNRKQYRLDELNREVSVNKQLYESFFSRIKETSEAGQIQPPNARIIDPAVVPTRPAKPRRVFLTILALVISLVAGALLALLREAYDRTVKNRDDVIFKLQAQLLGVLPFLKEKDHEGGDIARLYTRSGIGTFAESIRTIRTSLVLSALDSPHKVIVVTSSVPHEGKTTVSCNLAAAFGQVGKTLLIDADMRRPTIATRFGIRSGTPGLSNLVAETATLKECITHDETADIDIITAGVIPPNPLELLSSKRFAAVLASLEKHYDRVIIDTAPCEVVSDAMVLATYASAIVYVVKADATSIKVIKSGISRLKESGSQVTGIILNQVDVERRSGYAYGYGRYYGGYYDYYGYSSPRVENKVGEKAGDKTGANVTPKSRTL